MTETKKDETKKDETKKVEEIEEIEEFPEQTTFNTEDMSIIVDEKTEKKEG